MRRHATGRSLRFESLEDRRLLALNPSANEQEFLQLTNRFRTNPQAEFDYLISSINPIASPDPDIDFNLKFWRVNGTELARQWQSLTPAPPLAWHESLLNAARGHNQQMISHHAQEHQFPGEPDPGQRMQNAGYPTRGWAENIAAHCTSVFQCHGSYIIDWGQGPNGIQNPPGHRNNLMNPAYREIGIGVTPHTPGNQLDVGPLVTTQDLSTRSNFGNAYVVGAVFVDRNNTGWYESGEGVGQVTVKLEGSAGTFQTTSMTAGGYQVQVPAGTYTATASGGSLREPITMNDVVVGNDNVWLNFIQEPQSLPADRFEPNNSSLAPTVLLENDVREERLSIHTPNNDDYFRWTAIANGTVKVQIDFAQQSGDLDLYLYDSTNTKVASSAGKGNREVINWQVTAGSSWNVVVRGADGATNPDYTLTIDGPGGSMPVAIADKTATNKETSVTINLAANDTDADGDLSARSVQITVQPRNGTVTVNRETGVATYSPATGFLGVDRFRYTVADAAGLVSAPAEVLVAVVDYAGTPWRNPTMPMDVDASGAVVPLDALVIINRLNERGPGPLSRQPTGADSPPAFVDTSADNFLSSIDVLRVVNFLNDPEGEGEVALLEELAWVPPQGLVAIESFPSRQVRSTTNRVDTRVIDRVDDFPHVANERELQGFGSYDSSPVKIAEWESLIEVLAEDAALQSFGGQ